jgi:streptogramin lyase
VAGHATLGGGVRLRPSQITFIGVIVALGVLHSSAAAAIVQRPSQRVGPATHAPVFRDWSTCGFPNSLSAGGDGNIWFEATDACYDVAVGYITQTGNISLYPTNSDPFELTACARMRGDVQTCSGRQRGAWLVNADPTFGGPLLERVNEAGHIRTVPLSGLPANAQFSVGVLLSDPMTMWVSFWVTLSQGSQGYVAAIVPQTGVVTAYALPQMNVVPGKLTLGADGNVWFVASNGYLGRVTPSGSIALYPTGASAPLGGITPGPDGNIWFTAGRQIGHTMASGTIQYVALPEYYEAGDIAAGADGNMWVTSDSYLIRLTLDGYATVFPIPYQFAEAKEIVRGPKRTLWFTEISTPTSRIGKVEL